MAPLANSNANNAGTPTGCYKCGRPGHWSRDCPSSSSSAPPSFAARPSSSSQQQKQPPFSGNSKSSASWKSGKPPLKPAAPTKPLLPRKRPKLTPDLLLSNDGLGYALEHFPRMVKIKGPGHEVEDLQSFLEAYVHWHSRILPYFSFSQFVEKVAKVGASRRVRMCVHDLKDKVARGDELKITPEDNNFDSVQADKDPFLDNDMPQGGDPWEEDYDNALPADVNKDVLDEFYKQAVEEPSDALPQTTVPSVSVLEPVSVDVSSSPAQAALGSIISEDQKLRMEANRLKALERAKARLAAPIAT